jgi:hypothetical protein
MIVQVAVAADGPQHLAGADGLQLAPQVAHVDLDRVPGRRLLVPPHRAQQLVLGHHRAGPADQHVQHRELARTQRHRRPGPPHLPPGTLHVQLPDPHPLPRPLAGRPPEQRPDLRHQHAERERLGDVAVRAQVQPVGLVDLTVLCGHQQHRRPYALGTQPLQHAITRQAGQHDVQQHDVERAGQRGPQRARSVRGRRDVHPLRGQSALQRAPHTRFVIRD